MLLFDCDGEMFRTMIWGDDDEFVSDDDGDSSWQIFCFLVVDVNTGLGSSLRTNGRTLVSSTWVPVFDRAIPPYMDDEKLFCCDEEDGPISLSASDDTADDDDDDESLCCCCCGDTATAAAAATAAVAIRVTYFISI